jgi:hypothetical protein
MKTVTDLAVHTLGPVLFVLLLAGAVLGVVIGALLLFDSARVMRWNATLNRWFSTRQAMRKLDQPVEVKRVVYRWHRLVGIVVLGAALYTLDALIFGFNTRALVRGFRDLGNPAILSLVVETVRIFLIVGNIAALVAAAVLVFRPSLLKGVEAWADRYYTGRGSTEALDVMRYQPDEFVQARPRLVGALIALGSLYTLAGLGLLLR